MMCDAMVYRVRSGEPLRTEAGDTVCPEPYWVVRNGPDAIATFFGVRDGLTAMVRARAKAKKEKFLKAVQIKPHGHQLKG